MMRRAIVFIFTLSILLTCCSGIEETTIPVMQNQTPTLTESPGNRFIINPVRQSIINEYPLWGVSKIKLLDTEVVSRFQMILFARNQMEQYIPGYLAAGFNGNAYVYLPARTSAGPVGLDAVPAQQAMCGQAQQQLSVWSSSPTMDAGDFCEIHDAIVKNSALADYPDLYPTENWFLHKLDNSRIVYGYAGDGATFYIMNPGNPDWRAYFSRRALREVVQTDPNHIPITGVTGIFIDNLNSTYYFLMTVNNGLPSREYPFKPEYDKALAGLMAVMHETLSPYGKPILGNLSDMDEPAVWDLFLPYLDGVVSETWVTHWKDGLASPSRIENQLSLAEKILAQGKVFLGVAQGSSSGDYNKFVLACYLLITDGQNAFYRYKNYYGEYQEYYEIPEYFSNLGGPLGPRKKISDGPVIYQRSFNCGLVTANLTTGEAEIVVTKCK
jgi:hypothetical protein